MSGPIESVLVHVFRVPVGPPEPPSGSYARVEAMRASPRYLWYRLLGVGFGTVAFMFVELVLMIGSFASGEIAPALVGLGFLLLALPGLLFAFLAVRIDYALRYYVLTDRSLRVRQGAWVVDEKTLTYANVQNVRVTQGPLQRLFRISDVRVDTAGGGVVATKHGSMGSAHGIVIAGIENAAEVRDEILVHLRLRARDAGLGDLDERASERGARASWSAEHVQALREIARSAGALRTVAAARRDLA